MASLSHLNPGDKGKVQVSVDLRGKRGQVTKTVQVLSNDPKKPVTTLTVTALVRDSMHLQKFSPGKIFDKQCSSCHVEQGRGKTGIALFQADCFMCHNAGTKASAITGMSRRPEKYLRMKIRDGIEQSMMPGWSLKSGGPLTDEEVDSLVRAIRNPN